MFLDTFTITVTPDDTILDEEEAIKVPYLDPKPEGLLTISAGAAFTLFLGIPTSAYEENEVETKVELDEARFLKYDENTHILSLDEEVTTNADSKLYAIKIKMKDTTALSEDTVYIWLIITPVDEASVIEPVYDISDYIITEERVREEEPVVEEEPQPPLVNLKSPKRKSSRPNGMIEIYYNDPVRFPSDFID